MAVLNGYLRSLEQYTYQSNQQSDTRPDPNKTYPAKYVDKFFVTFLQILTYQLLKFSNRCSLLGCDCPLPLLRISCANAHKQNKV